MSEQVQSSDAARRRIDGHRLEEFIYGTVTALIAVAGLTAGHGESWSAGMVTVIAGAVAVWFAHAYSGLMSMRVTAGRPLTAAELGHELRATWPVAAAGIIVSLPLLLVAFGVIAMTPALNACSVFGIVMLALVGVLAGVLVKATVGRTIVLAVMSASVGLFVVAIEVAVHH